MDILTLKSKVKLGCNMCDKCCVYRGDIKLTPINVCNIAKYLKISNKEFIERYTDKLENRPLELVLKTRGEKRECILYDREIHGCRVHKVKPMQCTMFPLVPENIKRDYFVDSEECKIKDAKEITVNKWLNGNNNNYKKNKEIVLEWIDFLENVQPKLENAKQEQIDNFYKILFCDYDSKVLKKRQMEKKMKNIIKILNQK